MTCNQCSCRSVCLPEVEDSTTSHHLWFYNMCSRLDKQRWRCMQHPPPVRPAWGGQQPSGATARSVWDRHRTGPAGCTSYLLGSSVQDLDSKQPGSRARKGLNALITPFTIRFHTFTFWTAFVNLIIKQMTELYLWQRTASPAARYVFTTCVAILTFGGGVTYNIAHWCTLSGERRHLLDHGYRACVVIAGLGG